MIKFKQLACYIASGIFMLGCDQVLETVTLSNVKQNVKVENNQENFEINIKSLTFERARQANNDPYPRRIMLTGIGSSANVFDEADFLGSDIPPTTSDESYLLGTGDELTFKQLNEFSRTKIKFPSQKTETDYLLGVGDELTLTQLSDGDGSLSANILGTSKNNTNDNINRPQSNESILKTSSVVGTNGNILLLGLGSIKTENRTLSEIQTEVRNIFIRNGYAPTFQLEITGFNSKKAFITFSNIENSLGNNIIPITNLPITLKELAIRYFLKASHKETAVIILKRDSHEFRFTAGQLFEKSTPRILIEDRDEIQINNIEESPESIVATVGSKGNILLPKIGSLKAENRSLTDIQSDITRKLKKDGMRPNFQLEITSFNSKKFFLSYVGVTNKAINLKSSKLTLKEAVLDNVDNIDYNNNFLIINLVRDGKSYRMTFQEMLNNLGKKVFIKDGDTLELKAFNYKLGQVFALIGAGNAKILAIDPSKRETLADILFTPGGAVSNLLAKRSEVYLLRGQKPSVAYHLDAQNVSRILVAAMTELRPNDIVYVADRPIVSFSRTLAELVPLRILLRDIQDDNIP
jgi:polysaccharide biosynthesis/export protein